MRKRILSVVLILFLAFGAFGITAPLMQEEAYGAMTVRTSMPSFTSAAGKAYYYTNNNIYYKYDLGPNQKRLSGGTYCIGNCTWYAYARAGEILGKTFNTNFRKSASQWWSINKNGNYYPYGSTPKAGAIACYTTHVAIVEKVVNGKVYVSESGWKLSSVKPTSASSLYFHYGTPWNKTGLKGYIYINDTADATAANVSYSVKVSVTDLNMRTGPGTGYSKIGKIKPGTYTVDKQSGNWARLASNGYWICLNYATKVETASETIVDTGTAANYQVKVSVSNLNMRTGPSTSYAKKGYIKPGTYTITKTSNGWGKLSDTGYWIYLSYTSKVEDVTVTTPADTTTPDTTTTDDDSDVSATLYQVKVPVSDLNMRTGPGTNYSKKGKATKNAIYDIKDTQNGWGQLASNGYWIKLSYTIPVDGEYNVKVSVTSLNMRTGPGTGYAKKGYIKTGVHTISQTSGNWGKLKSNGYWIHLSYVTKI
ncbi:MAG: CHAP domain-containing protein [Bacillota bacterium]|nr:CHAP domain-containing protein [Bacillota bacterium]